MKGPQEAGDTGQLLDEAAEGNRYRNRARQSAVELLTSEAEGRHSAPASGVTPGKHSGQGVRPRIPKAGTDTPVLRSILQNLERTPSPLRV